MHRKEQRAGETPVPPHARNPPRSPKPSLLVSAHAASMSTRNGFRQTRGLSRRQAVRFKSFWSATRVCDYPRRTGSTVHRRGETDAADDWIVDHVGGTTSVVTTDIRSPRDASEERVRSGARRAIVSPGKTSVRALASRRSWPHERGRDDDGGPAPSNRKTAPDFCSVSMISFRRPERCEPESPSVPDDTPL